MKRRTLLRNVGGAGLAATSLAGCIGGVLNCGPGETKLKSINKNPSDYEEEEVKVKGDIASMAKGEKYIMLNDSTAKARVEPFMGEFDKSAASNGDCGHVTGIVMVDETENSDDVVLVATSFKVETVKVEE